MQVVSARNAEINDFETLKEIETIHFMIELSFTRDFFEELSVGRL